MTQCTMAPYKVEKSMGFRELLKKFNLLQVLRKYLICCYVATSSFPIN